MPRSIWHSAMALVWWGLAQGCTPPPSSGEVWWDDSDPPDEGIQNQTWPDDSYTHVTPSGELSVLSGMALDEIASVRGPGNRCGRDRPLVLADHSGDGVPELALGCDAPYEGNLAEKDLYVLDGGAALDSRFDQLGLVPVRTHGFSALGDLDGDGLIEMGFGLPIASPEIWDEVAWWTLLPGAALSAHTNLTTAGVTLTSSAQLHGNGAPRPVGDVDGDGVDDLVVWQGWGGAGPVMHLVSGAEAIAPGGLSVDQGTLRTLRGMDREEVPADVAGVGDVDGDGQPDLAVAVDGKADPPGGNQIPTVVVPFGDTLNDLGSTTRILGNFTGQTRHAQVEALGDLDGDGLPELAVLLTTSTVGTHLAQLAVIPGDRLGQTGIVDPEPYALGGIWSLWSTLLEPNAMEACDLDGDGLPELVLDAGTWDGRDLLTPGALPIGYGAGNATCAGDLDGVPGDELLVGKDQGG